MRCVGDRYTVGTEDEDSAENLYEGLQPRQENLAGNPSVLQPCQPLPDGSYPCSDREPPADLLESHKSNESRAMVRQITPKSPTSDAQDSLILAQRCGISSELTFTEDQFVH